MKKYLFLAILLCCQMVEATIILVDSNQDTLTNDGNCTLKEALLAANLNVAVDQCPAGQTFPTQDVIELLPNVLNDAIELGFQYPIIEGVSLLDLAQTSWFYILLSTIQVIFFKSIQQDKMLFH